VTCLGRFLLVMSAAAFVVSAILYGARGFVAAAVGLACLLGAVAAEWWSS